MGGQLTFSNCFRKCISKQLVESKIFKTAILPKRDLIQVLVLIKSWFHLSLPIVTATNRHGKYQPLKQLVLCYPV